METSTPHDSTSQRPLHVVLGGGQIGERLAQLLASDGHPVRVVQRSANATQTPNIQRVQADVVDAAARTAAVQGASVIYDCMNPLYVQWPKRLLLLGAAGVEAARTAQAKLVALDCLYMYGIPNGPMREDSPRNPCSKKGELRVKLEQLRMQAQQRGDVQVAIARASDYFGTRLTSALFVERFWQRLFAGQALECPGNPDMPHSYSYADDVARGLATLGTHEQAMGQIWHLPTSSHVSSRELLQRVVAEAGSRSTIRAVPKWLFQGAGMFSPMIREMAEMVYQWQVPYVLDDSKFRTTFQQEPTPLDQAISEMVAWARDTYRKEPSSKRHEKSAVSS